MSIKYKAVLSFHKFFFSLFLFFAVFLINCSSNRLYLSNGYLAAEYALNYLGAPYRYGSMGPEYFDCSGLVYISYLRALGINLPRTVKDIYNYTERIHSPRKGDLVFFKTGGSRRVNHIGIYLENGNFIHASKTRGVIISNIKENYYRRHLTGFRRVGVKPVVLSV